VQRVAGIVREAALTPGASASPVAPDRPGMLALAA
jgi:hypothetical protein